jgi:acetyltransferase-like isoleucine patch superfamily enzyme
VIAARPLDGGRLPQGNVNLSGIDALTEAHQHIEKLGYIVKLIRTNPFELLALLPTAWTTFKFRHVLRRAGRGSIVGKGTIIINPTRVTIGDHCLIMDHVYMRCGVEGRIEIGDRCAINSHAKLFGHGSIHIGSQSQIGPAAILTTTSHDYQNNLEAVFLPITIGRNSWIGAGSIVLPGVSVGDNCVIGAGSVVTKSIPSNAVAVGNPAKVIKVHG